jgi:phosphate transport system substrate-binding protein
MGRYGCLRGSVWVVLAGLMVGLSGCEGGDSATGNNANGDALTGKVKIDGSSTVFPIMQLAAELFMEANPKVLVSVGRSGSGAGFKKFLDATEELRTDIADASRCIKSSEVEKAAEMGVEFVEVPVAYDGIAVVVHPSNTFVDYLTVEELHAIWGPDSTIDNWQDVRPGFPDQPLKLYGPTGDSGTYEYFTHAINGEARACRQDYAPSATIQVVQGVAGDKNALGFFGFSYYVASADRLKLVAVKDGEGPEIKPSFETIADQSYKPLSRPLFIYVNKAAAQRKEVSALLDYFFDHAKTIVENENVNYIGLSDKLYAAMRQRIKDGVTGTVYSSMDDETKSLYDLYGVAK